MIAHYGALIGRIIAFPAANLSFPTLGTWLRDLMSDTSADAVYVGTDINPGYFPKIETPSVSFVQQSFLDPQPGEWKGNFDLVNQRFAFAAAMGAPIQPIVNNLAGLLKSGGFLQCTEMDLDAPEGAVMIKVTGLVKRILTMVKGEQQIASKLPGLMETAGLVDIGSRVDKVLVGPANPDPKMAKESVKSMVMTVEGLVAASAHMPPGAMGEDITDLPEWVNKELSSNGGSWTVHTIWGKKP